MGIEMGKGISAPNRCFPVNSPASYTDTPMPDKYRLRYEDDLRASATSMHLSSPDRRV